MPGGGFIVPEQYGKLCRIWNHLGKMAEHDFLVLLGDDVRLLDKDWEGRIVQCFYRIAKKNPHLPFGAACVAMNDLSFPGFSMLQNLKKRVVWKTPLVVTAMLGTKSITSIGESIYSTWDYVVSNLIWSNPRHDTNTTNCNNIHKALSWMWSFHPIGPITMTYWNVS